MAPSAAPGLAFSEERKVHHAYASHLTDVFSLPHWSPHWIVSENKAATIDVQERPVAPEGYEVDIESQEEVPLMPHMSQTESQLR